MVFYNKSIEFMKTNFLDYCLKLRGLYKDALFSYKREGLINVLRRTMNYILFGSGTLHVIRLKGKAFRLTYKGSLYDIMTKDKNYKPRVTVIVPNYNHAKFLEQRLESIYSQTYDNYEVILLDDKSTDNSRDILLKYAAKYNNKTRYIFNENNSGSVYKQWELGMAEANGELIWVAESDDYCSNNFLKSLVRYFSDELVMIAYCRSVFKKNDSVIWDTESYLEDIDPIKWKNDFVESAHQIVNYAMARKNIIPNVSSAIFRNPRTMRMIDRDKWRSLRLCGDWIFYLQVMRGGAIAYTTKATNYYRQHDSNVSSKIQEEDIYYKEHEYVASVISELYNVPRKIFIAQKVMLEEHWKLFRSSFDKQEFEKLYDIEKIHGAAKKRKPNIAKFGFGFSAGGGETFPIFLSNILYENGYAVTFVDCDQEPREDGVRKMLNPSIPVIKLLRPNTLPLYMKALGIEILHSCHSWVDTTINKMMENMRGTKHIITLHGGYETLESGSLETILPSLLASVTKWIYTTEKNLSIFKKRGYFNKEKFMKIENALSRFKINPILRHSIGIKDDAFVFCLVSRAIPEKGWEEAINCVTKARIKSGKDIQLVIIGDGIEKERLQKQSPEFIHFLGFQRNIRGYYMLSDMGILPSRFGGESFPLIIIDCLFAGKPVLSSEIGEIRTMLSTENGKLAGALFKLIDWTIPQEELADLMVRCATDPVFYGDMLKEVEEAAKNFDIKKVYEKYNKCYMNILERK